VNHMISRPTTSDHDLQLEVIAEIERDWRFAPAELGVEVDKGIVTLTGTVSSYLKVGEAAEIAARIPGVRGVANKLTVKLTGNLFTDDTKIAEAVRTALTWDSVVPEERIEIVVRNGVVTLTGMVEYWYQRKSAVDVVKRLSGVTNVNDHIIVAPQARSDEVLFSEIKASLTRRLPLEDIDVTVDHGTVTLMGTASSYRVRREAEDIAWWTIGVKNLTNRISIR
jgi:osmotically-inducible protein OsmY